MEAVCFRGSVAYVGLLRVTRLQAQVADLGEKFRGAQQGLAEATAEQVQAESSSNLKGQQHSELLQDFQKAMKECCDGTNELKSQMCALEKIRGELYNMKGPGVYITDCSVSDWVVGDSPDFRVESGVWEHPSIVTEWS